MFKEAISWRQRMKSKWVKEGDSNTILFHSLVSNKSVIARVESDEGVVLQSTSGI